MNEKYNEATNAPYLAWPDARLRAQLRSYGVDDKKLVGRDSLLQEMRVRYVEAGNTWSNLYNEASNYVYKGVSLANDAAKNFLGVSRGRVYSSTCSILTT